MSAQLFAALLLAGGMAGPSPRTAEKKDAAFCAQLWETEASDAPDTTPWSTVVERMLTHRAECTGTVVYEARLAMAYTFAGQNEQAMRLVKPLVEHRRYGPLARFALIYAELYHRPASEEEEARRLEEALRGFVQKYPDQVPEAWARLGTCQTLLKKHRDAIASYRRALAYPLDHGFIYRRLTINHALLGEYREAIEAANRAAQIDDDFSKYPDFTIVAAMALVEVGDLETAEAALEVLAAKRPEYRDSPNFKTASDFLQRAKHQRSK